MRCVLTVSWSLSSRRFACGPVAAAVSGHVRLGSIDRGEAPGPTSAGNDGLSAGDSALCGGYRGRAARRADKASCQDAKVQAGSAGGIANAVQQFSDGDGMATGVGGQLAPAQPGRGEIGKGEDGRVRGRDRPSCPHRERHSEAVCVRCFTLISYGREDHPMIIPTLYPPATTANVRDQYVPSRSV